MTNLEALFLHCAGVDKQCAKESPHDLIKLASMGRSILITTFFSSISFFYAINLVSNHLIISAFLSMIWASFIYNTDRYIVSSISNDKNKYSKAIPRIILSIIIAYSIAVPIELIIFEDEIEEYIKSEELLEINKNTDIINVNRKEITSPKELTKKNWIERHKKLSTQIKDCNDNVTKTQHAYQCEHDGTCGTGKAGPGPNYILKYKIYKDTKKSCKEKEEKYANEIQSLSKNIKEIDKEIKIINNKYNKEVTSITKEIKQASSDSLSTRIESLNTLSNKSQVVEYTKYFIMAIIFFIELMPVFIKLMNRNREYDECLEFHRELRFEKNKKIRMQMKDDIKTENIEYEKKFSELRLKIANLYSNIFDEFEKNKVKIFTKRYKEVFEEIKSNLNISKENKEQMNKQFNDPAKMGKIFESYKYLSLFITILILSIFSSMVYISTSSQSIVSSYIFHIVLLTNVYIFLKKYIKSGQPSEIPN